MGLFVDSTALDSNILISSRREVLDCFLHIITIFQKKVEVRGIE